MLHGIPRSGIELVSPTLAGRFFTTGPWGTSLGEVLKGKNREHEGGQRHSLAELSRLERTCWYKEEKPIKRANSWRGCRRTRFVQHCGGLWRRKTWSRKRYSAILNKAENSRCLCVLVTSTLCDPVGYSLPGSSGHGISQARILEWVASSFSRVSSWPRDWTQVSCRQILYHLSCK